MAVAEDGHTFSPLLRGQEREVGNLYAEVPAMARKGKAQFDDLFAAGRAHSDDDSHQPALECFGSAYVMARELHYRLGEAMALEQAALVYSTLGDQSRALEMLSAAVRLFEMASDGGGLVTSLLNLGEVHTQLEQMEKAAEVLARGRAAASRLHCPELELAAIVKGAIVELRQHHPSEAIRLLGQALGIAVALGDAREEVRILQRLAAAHSEIAEECLRAVRSSRGTEEGALELSEDMTDRAPLKNECTHEVEQLTETKEPLLGCADGPGDADGEGNSPADAQMMSKEAVVAKDVKVQSEEAWSRYQQAMLSAVRILERADKLAAEAACGEELSLQVLRQLRACHERLSQDDLVARCEDKIDRLIEVLMKRRMQCVAVETGGATISAR